MQRPGPGHRPPPLPRARSARSASPTFIKATPGSACAFSPIRAARRRATIGGAMDLFEALYTTRAMRRMQARDIPDDLVSRILDAAIRAPSGGGFQNWCFIVIRD